MAVVTVIVVVSASTRSRLTGRSKVSMRAPPATTLCPISAHRAGRILPQRRVIGGCGSMRLPTAAHTGSPCTTRVSAWSAATRGSCAHQRVGGSIPWRADTWRLQNTWRRIPRGTAASGSSAKAPVNSKVSGSAVAKNAASTGSSRRSDRSSCRCRPSASRPLWHWRTSSCMAVTVLGFRGTADKYPPARAERRIPACWGWSGCSCRLDDQPMTTKNKQLVETFIQDLFTRGDPDAVDRYLDPQFVNHDPPFRPAPSRANALARSDPKPAAAWSATRNQPERQQTVGQMQPLLQTVTAHQQRRTLGKGFRPDALSAVRRERPWRPRTGRR